VTGFTPTVGAGGVVTFTGTYENATTWTIFFGDGTNTGPHIGPVAATDTYVTGDYYPYLVVNKGSLTSTKWTVHIAIN
jgi:hypothetical protein